jgi:hypothetical protein
MVCKQRVLRPICAGGYLLQNSGGREPEIDYLMLTENETGPEPFKQKKNNKKC